MFSLGRGRFHVFLCFKNVVMLMMVNVLCEMPACSAPHAVQQHVWLIHVTTETLIF